ncbi:MAG TPA: polysaccharide deacetylase family protein [Bacteroidales bacterium]
MSRKKPLASISLDLDNEWSYMKVHGDEGWDKFPSYLDVVLPVVLDILDELDIKITFFVVGQDAAIESNRNVLRTIVERGHEIGNHSFHHESWLKTYSREKIEEEIKRAEDAIENAIGQRPTGFRGPGFSWSQDLLEVLQSRGYKFDASVLPTYISPLMRMYYFWNSNLTKEEKESRKELFGSFREGFVPLKPFKWELNHSNLVEIPVTTIPVFKVPFHLSYLLYISRISIVLMKMYLYFAIFMCKITRTSPSFLLHPLDIISGDKVPTLKFFPGMDLPSEKKIKVFKIVFRILGRHFKLVNMSQHANSLSSNLKVREIK